MFGYSSILPIAQKLIVRRGLWLHPIRGLLIIAIAYCVASSCLAWTLPDATACLSLSLGCFCMAVLFVCDMHMRILPTELVGLLLGLSIAYRLSHGNMQELGIIITAIAPLAALLLVWNRVRANAGKAELLGSGDVRMLLPLALFSGSSGLVEGLMAGAAVMGAIALLQFAFFGVAKDEGIALAPGLAAWLIVGALI